MDRLEFGSWEAFITWLSASAENRQLATQIDVRVEGCPEIVGGAWDEHEVGCCPGAWQWSPAPWSDEAWCGGCGRQLCIVGVNLLGGEGGVLWAPAESTLDEVERYVRAAVLRRLEWEWRGVSYSVDQSGRRRAVARPPAEGPEAPRKPKEPKPRGKVVEGRLRRIRAEIADVEARIAGLHRILDHEQVLKAEKRLSHLRAKEARALAELAALGA